jgi:hypothetical protein
MLFNFALEYAIRKVHENPVGLKLNGTNQLPAYSYDVNLLGDNIQTIKKNPETLTAVFWDVVPCESCKNRRFGGMCHLHLQGRKIRVRRNTLAVG